MAESRQFATVRLTIEDRIAWVVLDRPEKRNAMNPQVATDMLAVLDLLEEDPGVGVLVLTGAGEAWSAGMDLKEYFRALEHDPAARARAFRETHEWRWRRLFTFPKPTIAMVNGYCFGGAFTQLIACDFAIAAEDAVFGLSEINWGIFPGGLVARVLADAMTLRDAMYYILTGATFDGRRAAQMRLVTEAVPRDRLREATLALAATLLAKNPHTLRAAKEAYKTARTMDYWQAEEYFLAKAVALRATDPDQGYEKGIAGFVDQKAYRPGFGHYSGRDREPQAGPETPGA